MHRHLRDLRPRHAALGEGRPSDGSSPREERGAILILALFFMISCSMVVLALATLASDDLQSTARLKTQRNLEYAATGAVEAAIQAVRYSTNAFTAYNGITTSLNCLPSSVTSLTIGGVVLYVDCAGVLNANSAQTRVVDLYACTSSSCLAANAVIHAQVTFDDFSSTSVDTCTLTTLPGSCGTGMTISSWVIQGANQ